MLGRHMDSHVPYSETLAVPVARLYLCKGGLGMISWPQDAPCRAATWTRTCRTASPARCQSPRQFTWWVWHNVVAPGRTMSGRHMDSHMP